MGIGTGLLLLWEKAFHLIAVVQVRATVSSNGVKVGAPYWSQDWWGTVATQITAVLCKDPKA